MNSRPVKEYLIAFPSYGRPASVKTLQHFDTSGVACFVEPREFDKYILFNPGQTFKVYPENGWNISMKRKWILNYAVRERYHWLFMLEDDLTGLFIRRGLTPAGHPKLVSTEWRTVVNLMLGYAKMHDIVELGLSQKQSNHYFEEPEYKPACKVTEFCLFDLDRLLEGSINYDPALQNFEDFDITIQILMQGMQAGIYTAAAFEHVTMGTNPGGHQADGNDRKANTTASIQRMIEKYPEYVSLGEGRLFPEPKVKWAELRKKLA